MIIEKEREAGKILEEAKVQADRIKQETQEKAEEVFNKAYEQIIAEAKLKSIELQKKAKEARARAHEADAILRRAEEQIKEIQMRAKKKFEEAVNVALGEIIS